MRAGRLVILVLLLPVAGVSQFTVPSQVTLSPTLKVKSDFSKLENSTGEERKAALYELHRDGKEAIPLLIDSLDSAEPFDQVALADPISSFIPPDSLKRSPKAALYAYTIELILGRVSLKGDPTNSAALIDHDDCVYRYGLLKRDGALLRTGDLSLLKATYRAWLEKHKDLSLEQLRQLWTENKRPLSNSVFNWS